MGKQLHETFGGILYASDFCTESRGGYVAKESAIAGRIERDFAFDRQCRKNREGGEGHENSAVHIN